MPADTEPHFLAPTLTVTPEDTPSEATEGAKISRASWRHMAEIVRGVIRSRQKNSQRLGLLEQEAAAETHSILAFDVKNEEYYSAYWT